MNESLLVGPGKKFADYNALEQGKLEADNFIEQLKTEQARLRDELDQRLSYEDFLTRMEEQSRRNTNQPPLDNQPKTPEFKPSDDAKLTLQDIERVVELRETRKALELNRNNALSQYAAANGPNHATKLEQQASDLGMTKQALLDMAAQNPKAFYRLTGLEGTRKPEGFTPPPQTRVNSDSFQPTAGNTKNFAYYETLRKEDSRAYWTPRVQNEILSQLSAMGDDFYK